MLLELQRNRVQIFISTHDYILAKYFEVKQQSKDKIIFYSFYEENDEIICEQNEYFKNIKNNTIISSFNKLLDEVFNKDLGD